MIEPGRAGSAETMPRSDCASSVMLKRAGRGSGIKGWTAIHGSVFLALAYGV